MKKHRDKATIEAEKAAAAEEKVRKAEEKVVTRAKAVNRLAALHIPVDGVVKTPRPLAKVFEQCEARCLSQASSMLVVEGESPMIPQNNKRSNTHSDDETLPTNASNQLKLPQLPLTLMPLPRYKHLLAILMLIARRCESFCSRRRWATCRRGS